MKNFKIILLAIVFAGQSGSPVFAQGIPVYDNASVAQAVEQVRVGMRQLQTAADQLSELQKQVQEAQRIYNAANRLTNANSIGDVLNNPLTREFLPPTVQDIGRVGVQVEGISTAASNGRWNEVASRAGSIRIANRVTSQTAEEYYRNELNRVGDQRAGTLAVAQQIYNTSAARLEGLEQLRLRISTADNQADIQALQTRIQAEIAMIQNDQMRVQALQMQIRGQEAMNAQRGAEARRAAGESALQEIRRQFPRR